MMKTIHLSLPFFRVLVVGLGAMSVGPLALHGQETALIYAAPTGCPILKVDFPGGTVSELVEALNATNRGRLNLIVAPAAVDLPVPKLKLRGASTHGLTLARNAVLPAGSHVQFAAGHQTTFGGDPVMTISAPPASPSKLEYRISTQTFSIATIVNKIPAEDVADAVMTAWSLDDLHRPEDMKLKLHPATKILTMTGPERSSLGGIRGAGVDQPVGFQPLEYPSLN